ncbi:hypothetical protein DPMN_094350 [Dreissena polymorpha]|uniref:Uncharacterized protein n=1 Tax=Dreissena polymorpha TaxID=45954 RepID=A0A9D4R2L5_DREPO|nr:hypothetical protein DPMN_094350 [Dreissena polymorpha]
MYSSYRAYSDGEVHFRRRFVDGDDGNGESEADVSSDETDDGRSTISMNQPTGIGSTKQPTNTGATNQPTEESSAHAQLSEMAAILKDVVKELHLLKQTSQNNGGNVYSDNNNNKSAGAGEGESYDVSRPCRHTSPMRRQRGVRYGSTASYGD